MIVIYNNAGIIDYTIDDSTNPSFLSLDSNQNYIITEENFATPLKHKIDIETKKIINKAKIEISLNQITSKSIEINIITDLEVNIDKNSVIEVKVRNLSIPIKLENGKANKIIQLVDKGIYEFFIDDPRFIKQVHIEIEVI